MSAQKPNLPFTAGPKPNVDTPRRDNPQYVYQGQNSGTAGRDPGRKYNYQGSYDGRYAPQTPVWQPRNYAQQEEVRRNPQGALGGLNASLEFGHAKIPLELQQTFPNTVPPLSGSFAQPWMMHPAGEQGIHQISNLPVPSFSSSHGSPDGSEYGSGAASNADLSVNEMLIAGDQGAPDLDIAYLTTRDALRKQIDYYFSPENLARDKYLLSKLDGQRFADVSLIATFRMVVRLSQDIAQITDAIRSSEKLELDETGTKVRARNVRTTLVMEDVPENLVKEDIETWFVNYRSTKVELTEKHCWCIDFEDESEANAALVYLSSQAFFGNPIHARLKTSPVVGSVNAFKPVDNGFHVPGVQDESVQMNRSGDLAPAHPYAAFAPYPSPNSQYFPAMANMNQVVMWPSAMPGMTYIEMYNQLAAFSSNLYGTYAAQSPAAPPYRAPMSHGRGGRGVRRGGSSGTYSNNTNRRGRGGSHPNSGRNSAMSDTRSEHDYNTIPAHPDQNSRHGSFSSVNGTQDIISPTSTRSSSNTPPEQLDHRDGYAEEKRNNSYQTTRKASRPFETQTNDDSHGSHGPQPAAAKEPLPNFDLVSTMFPPLPGQLPSDFVSNAPAISPPVPLLSANLSAADIVRGVSSPKVHSSSKSVTEGDSGLEGHDPSKATAGSSRGQHIAQFVLSNPIKKEQGSSTDDLPTSGRDHGDPKTRSEFAVEKAKISSSGTQTPSSSASTQVNFSTSSDQRTSPIKVSPKKERCESAGLGASPDGSRTDSYGHSPRTGGVSRASDEGNVSGATIESKNVSLENGKNDTFSYARIAQMNRDKLLASGSTGGNVPATSKPSLSKQISADSSSQSQEEKRSGVHMEPSAPRALMKSNHREQRTQTRPSDIINGHADDNRQERLANGTEQTESGDLHGEDDDEGFTAVIKHKTPRHENRGRGNSFPH